MSAPRVRTGLERLLSQEIHLLRGKRVGLVCNASSVTADLAHAADLFAAHPDFELLRLFGPEHGIRGDAQDMIAVDGERSDARTGVPVVSLYGRDEKSLWPKDEQVADLDLIVFDIQDVGARYYTYVYTLAYCMSVAGRLGKAVVVCDRPNPISGTLVEGNLVQPGYESFVGRFPLPNRHGMTAGELAQYFAGHGGMPCSLHVVEMDGWRREMSFTDTGLPWVLPSPNMPTPETALVYPGMCFFEGTLLSEGRGCTRPFEIVGAPFIRGDRWAEEALAALAAGGYRGHALRPLVFRPTFHKHHGQPCGGVQVHVTDGQAFRPVMVATALLQTAWKLWPKQVQWRSYPYEFVSEPIAIDLLAGSDALRAEVEGQTPLRRIQKRWDEEAAGFAAIRRRYLIYGAERPATAAAKPPAKAAAKKSPKPRAPRPTDEPATP
jgi:uncharacterized protein YbbC (DUF1343 family)